MGKAMGQPVCPAGPLALPVSMGQPRYWLILSPQGPGHPAAAGEYARRHLMSTVGGGRGELFIAQPPGEAGLPV